MSGVYRVCNRFGYYKVNSLDALKRSLEDSDEPVMRIRRVTTEDIELPDFVVRHNKRAENKKGQGK